MYNLQEIIMIFIFLLLFIMIYELFNSHVVLIIKSPFFPMIKMVLLPLKKKNNKKKNIFIYL